MSEKDSKIFAEHELRTFAQEICGGDREIFLELLGDCKADLTSQMKTIREERAAENWRDLNRAAHTIKSTGRTFGSPRIKEVAFRLEELSANGNAESNLPGIDESIESLQSAAAEFSSTLEGVIEDPRPFLD